MYNEVCDEVEEVFVSCFTGIVIGVFIFGGICLCVIKNKICCLN